MVHSLVINISFDNFLAGKADFEALFQVQQLIMNVISLDMVSFKEVINSRKKEKIRIQSIFILAALDSKIIIHRFVMVVIFESLLIYIFLVPVAVDLGLDVFVKGFIFDILHFLFSKNQIHLSIKKEVYI